eukprot:TRINITY_DN6891_c0_g1_i1.p1 TRINITY_DN6891_c0_g1~~TRINITY_DN6891_c0_g1_i1.p1  ORF type:complete len:920 (-),score=130.56 TRINITY_DN6891_c0_g1_i1:96-2855(-)
MANALFSESDFKAENRESTVLLLRTEFESPSGPSATTVTALQQAECIAALVKLAETADFAESVFFVLSRAASLPGLLGRRILRVLRAKSIGTTCLGVLLDQDQHSDATAAAAAQLIVALVPMDAKLAPQARLGGTLSRLLSMAVSGTLQQARAANLFLALTALCDNSDANAVASSGSVPALVSLISAEERAIRHHGQQALLETLHLPLGLLLALCRNNPKAASAASKCEGIILLLRVLHLPKCPGEVSATALQNLLLLLQLPEGHTCLEKAAAELLAGNEGSIQLKITSLLLEGEPLMNDDQFLRIVNLLYRLSGKANHAALATGVPQIPLTKPKECPPLFSVELEGDVTTGKFSVPTGPPVIHPWLSSLKELHECHESLAQDLSGKALVVEDLLPPSEGGKREAARALAQRLRRPEELLNDVVFSNGNVTDLCNDTASPLRFCSNFEAGNLKEAIRVYSHEYDLVLHFDPNAAMPRAGWFFFGISNATQGTYTFNILNFGKGGSQFNRGQRPLLFSRKAYAQSGLGWRRCGRDIICHSNPFVRPQAQESKVGTYTTMRFSLDFEEEDEVWLASGFPYSFGAMMRHLRSLPVRWPQIHRYCRYQVLCKTILGNDCPILTATNFTGSIPIQDRKVFCVMARVHPSESPASLMAHGFIDFLLDPENQFAQQLLDRFVWKIVPMLNPDGVIAGNVRCSISGSDLNRCWRKPNPELHPCIYHLKKYLSTVRNHERRQVVFAIDLHSHARAKGLFLYACPTVQPMCVEDAEQAKLIRAVPQLVQRLVPYFSWPNCSFKVGPSKACTARAVFWRDLGVPFSFTCEVSQCGGTDVALQCSDGVIDTLAENKALDTTTGAQFAHFCALHFYSMGRSLAAASGCLTLVNGGAVFEAAMGLRPLDEKPQKLKLKANSDDDEEESGSDSG